VLGFTTIILMGTLLLMLPVANRSGETIPFLNSLFTAASATCVTGLVVYDTWSQFTIFGQIVIMILIQIGGLGFMTFAILFSMALGKRIGLRDRSFIMEAVSAMQLGGVVRLVRRILFGTIILEFVGAAILATRFIPVFGFMKGVWYGVFHSVSAFCNAGFDLMGFVSPYTSFTPFVHDPLVNLTLIVLIVLGGIGFVIWDDVIRQGWQFGKFSLHTKITILFTGGLIAVSTLAVLFLEWNTTLAGLSVLEKIMASLFQAITPRTAGFNTIDTAGLSEGGTLLTMILMVIGAGPGSTAGGIKVTTMAILFISVLANLRGQEDVNIYHRQVGSAQLRKAFTSTTIYILLAFTGCLIITGVQNISLKAAMFESFSAIGTVGLTTGITRDLLPLSRLVIIALMIAGRVGSLTVFMAVSERRDSMLVRYPTEKIIV
jgi:trk system potassium uptake protein